MELHDVVLPAGTLDERLAELLGQVGLARPRRPVEDNLALVVEQVDRLK